VAPAPYHARARVDLSAVFPPDRTLRGGWRVDVPEEGARRLLAEDAMTRLRRWLSCS
jgi:hypothetical protein